MLVTLHEACFEGGDLIALMSLFGVCRARGHALVLKPPDWRTRPEHALNRWLSAIDLAVAQSVRDFLRVSQTQASRLPGGTLAVEVKPLAESQWSQASLTIGDATLLLMAPLRLLVENERSDLSFLRRLVPQNYRRQLDSALERGELEAYHAGGIGEMKKILEGLLERSGETRARRVRRLRLWAMFDRDADPKDASLPSATSQAVASLCVQDPSQRGDPWPLVGHQLGRRAIESYLPDRVLSKWAEQGTGKERIRRREKVEALKDLRAKRPLVAWQLDMKKGLLASANKACRKRVEEQGQALRMGPPKETAKRVLAEDLDPLFRDLDDKQRGALAFGFGDVAGLYEGENFDPDGFVKEYERGPSEQVGARELVESILQRL